MTKLLRAIIKRSVTLATAFAVGVSAAMLWVYYLPDEQLGSDYPSLARVKEHALVWWHRPHAFRVFVPEKVEWPEDLVCIIPSRATLVVSMDEERRLTLNDSDMGTLADSSRLKDTLAKNFRWRVENQVWRVGVESRTDLPDWERIERSVFVQAAPSLKYGEVLKLIDEVKGAGAKPIGLRVDDIPPYVPLPHVPPNNGMHPTPLHGVSHARCAGARVMPGVRLLH